MQRKKKETIACLALSGYSHFPKAEETWWKKGESNLNAREKDTFKKTVSLDTAEGLNI